MRHSDWQEVRDGGGLFFVSHSGGKDSQAMLAHIVDDLRVPDSQIVVVHADLGDIEWDGVQSHIEDTCRGFPLNVVRAVDKAGDTKTFLSMVEARGMWPSPKHRQCTSDLKRGPIYKFIRRVMRERGALLAVNCTGLRAEESASRRKRPQWSTNSALSKAGREVYEWLPLHDWTTSEVFGRIYAAGQEPFHAYSSGNQRLSCVFCIMGSVNDHRNGARTRPELYARLVEMERRMGHTMFPGAALEERNGLTVDDVSE